MEVDLQGRVSVANPHSAVKLTWAIRFAALCFLLSLGYAGSAAAQQTCRP